MRFSLDATGNEVVYTVELDGREQKKRCVRTEYGCRCTQDFPEEWRDNERLGMFDTMLAYDIMQALREEV